MMYVLIVFGLLSITGYRTPEECADATKAFKNSGRYIVCVPAPVNASVIPAQVR